MFSYPQLSMHVLQHVNCFNQQHPETTALTDIYDNTLIYNREGLFVLCLQVMIGHTISDEYAVFNTLCQKYQTAKLRDIPAQDAELLWNEYLRLIENN